MQARQNGQKSYGNSNRGGSNNGEKTYPVFKLKKKVGGGDLEEVGGAFASKSKAGSDYYKVSKTPYIIFTTDKDDLALKMKPEDDGKLITVAYLKPATSKDGETHYTGKTKDGEETFYLFPFSKRA